MNEHSLTTRSGARAAARAPLGGGDGWCGGKCGQQLIPWPGINAAGLAMTAP
ncbi:MAG: hypothetical protein E6901_00400 [Cutibacterium granulosum]|nr:hypothetical protein [Cutibacterium granulosum]